MNIIFSVAGEGEEGGTASLVPPYRSDCKRRVEQAKRFHLLSVGDVQ